MLIPFDCTPFLATVIYCMIFKGLKSRITMFIAAFSCFCRCDRELWLPLWNTINTVYHFPKHLGKSLEAIFQFLKHMILHKIHYNSLLQEILISKRVVLFSLYINSFQCFMLIGSNVLYVYLPYHIALT